MNALLSHTILITSLFLAKKLAYRRKPRMQKLVIAGLGLAFLAFIAGSMKEYYVAGIIFVAIVILGIIGIIKLRKNK